MATKYAEWVGQDCGKCRFLIDIGSIAEKDIDPDCEKHQRFECAVCGMEADGMVARHGSLMDYGNIHEPERP